MRVLLVLVLACAAAGCMAPSSGSPAAAPPAPFQDVHLTHDHRSADEETRFDVPAGSGPFDVNVFFRPPSEVAACHSDDARIQAFAPDGRVYVDHKLEATLDTWAGPCNGGVFRSGVGLAPGTYAVKFTGSGLAVGEVDVSLAR